eukprot:TRINITY_DN2164_c0_g1_i1.p1 TRINITY_DN2164_c0_g1~~TRINITY_DN2164_c0_g1_i1.p1  ORF type:complete len:1322 (-),score=282.07 TRINITY_DN2164_c0_g1_i1:76-4041(-)
MSEWGREEEEDKREMVYEYDRTQLLYAVSQLIHSQLINLAQLNAVKKFLEEEKRMKKKYYIQEVYEKPDFLMEVVQALNSSNTSQLNTSNKLYSTCFQLRSERKREKVVVKRLLDGGEDWNSIQLNVRQFFEKIVKNETLQSQEESILKMLDKIGSEQHGKDMIQRVSSDDRRRSSFEQQQRMFAPNDEQVNVPDVFREKNGKDTKRNEEQFALDNETGPTSMRLTKKSSSSSKSADIQRRFKITGSGALGANTINRDSSSSSNNNSGKNRPTKKQSSKRSQPEQYHTVDFLRRSNDGSDDSMVIDYHIEDDDNVNIKQSKRRQLDKDEVGDIPRMKSQVSMLQAKTRKRSSTNPIKREKAIIQKSPTESETGGTKEEDSDEGIIFPVVTTGLSKIETIGGGSPIISQEQITCYRTSPSTSPLFAKPSGLKIPSLKLNQIRTDNITPGYAKDVERNREPIRQSPLLHEMSITGEASTKKKQKKKKSSGENAITEWLSGDEASGDDLINNIIKAMESSVKREDKRKRTKKRKKSNSELALQSSSDYRRSWSCRQSRRGGSENAFSDKIDVLFKYSKEQMLSDLSGDESGTKKVRPKIKTGPSMSQSTEDRIQGRPRTRSWNESWTRNTFESTTSSTSDFFGNEDDLENAERAQVLNQMGPLGDQWETWKKIMKSVKYQQSTSENSSSEPDRREENLIRDNEIANKKSSVSPTPQSPNSFGASPDTIVRITKGMIAKIPEGNESESDHAGGEMMAKLGMEDKAIDSDHPGGLNNFSDDSESLSSSDSNFTFHRNHLPTGYPGSSPEEKHHTPAPTVDYTYNCLLPHEAKGWNIYSGGCTWLTPRSKVDNDDPYKKHFVGKKHTNWIGNHKNLGPVAISIIKEGDYYRALIRTVTLNKLVLLKISDFKNIKNLNSKKKKKGEDLAILSGIEPLLTPRGVKEGMLKFSNTSYLEENLSNFSKLTCQNLIHETENFKFGIVYVRSGLQSEDDIWANKVASHRFEQFLLMMGDKVPLLYYKGYPGGLDTSQRLATGTHTIVTTYIDPKSGSDDADGTETRERRNSTHKKRDDSSGPNTARGNVPSPLSGNNSNNTDKEAHSPTEKSILSDISRPRKNSLRINPDTHSPESGRSTAVRRDSSGMIPKRTKSVVFHVSTYIPFKEVTRKTHIGNDVCIIVFKDDLNEEIGTQAGTGTNTTSNLLNGVNKQGRKRKVVFPYHPGTIQSKFNHVVIIVSPLPEVNGQVEKYRVEVASREGVPHFQPKLDDPPIFSHGPALREFLLQKLVNGERAVMKSSTYQSRIARSRGYFIQNLTEKLQQQGKAVEKLN